MSPALFLFISMLAFFADVNGNETCITKDGCDLEDGTTMEIGEEEHKHECWTCNCDKSDGGSGKSLSCCYNGPRYSDYPDTCEVVSTTHDCQRLVLKEDHSMPCDGDYTML